MIKISRPSADRGLWWNSSQTQIERNIIRPEHIHVSCQLFELYTEHYSAVLCAKFQNNFDIWAISYHVQMSFRDNWVGFVSDWYHILYRALDSFTVPLYTPNGRQLPARLFHALTRTTSSGCLVLHRTVHALWNLYGNPYRNRAEKEEETVTW